MTDIRKGVSRWGTPIALTLFAFVLFRAILFVGYVPTSSMEPTLEAGSYIMGSRISKDLNNGDIVAVKVENETGRGLVFLDTVVRVSPSYALAMHIDTDESNAAGMVPGVMGEIVK